LESIENDQQHRDQAKHASQPQMSFTGNSKFTSGHFLFCSKAGVHEGEDTKHELRHPSHRAIDPIGLQLDFEVKFDFVLAFSVE